MFKLQGPRDERGISEVLGAILVLGMLIGVGSVIYAQYVQSSIHSSEADHMNEVGEAFIKLKSSISVMEIGQSSIANIPMNASFPPLVPTSGEVGTLSIFPGIAHHEGANPTGSEIITGHAVGSLNALKADGGSYYEVNQVIFEEKFPNTDDWTMYEVLPDNGGDAFWDSYGHTSGDGTGSISVITSGMTTGYYDRRGRYHKGKPINTPENAYWEHDFGDSLDDYPNVTLQAWFGKEIDFGSATPPATDNAAWWIEVETNEPPENQTLYAHQENKISFVAAGTGSGTTGNPTPAYPTGLQANDLILLQVTVRDNASIPTTPSGFTLLYGPDSTGTGRQWIYYKVSDGTESGTITVTIGGTACKIARMYAFRNVALSSFTEGGSFGSGTDSTIDAQSVTTTGVNRLAVSFVFVNDQNSVGSFTGETSGDWTEAVSEFITDQGSNGCVQLQTATMPSAGTISGGSYTMGASDPWGVRAFALIPLYHLKNISADNTGTNLSVSTADNGRQLWGRFVYPLDGIRAIPASTWNLYYRSWYSKSTFYDNVSGENVYQGGTISFDNAKAGPDLEYENIFENDYGSTYTVTNSPSSNSGAWTSPTNAHADGGGYAGSATSNQQHEFDGYGFSIPSNAIIRSVRVRLDALRKTDDSIKLEVSTNGGSTFLATTTTQTLTTSETTYWENVTTWTSWTPSLLNTNNVWTRVTEIKNGGQDNVSLDWIPIEVIYQILAYRENVQHNITGIPSADNYQLQIGYYTVGDNEPVSAYLYNFTTWNWDNIGILLGGIPSNENTFTYNIDNNHISNGNVYVRYVQPDQDNIRSSLMVDYARVAFFIATPIAHSDVSILIRKSDGTIRHTIADNVADSNNITSTEDTYSGTYSFGGYTVENDNDYLEIDYYCHVTSAAPGTAYLKIDNNSLAPANQTRVENVLFVYHNANWNTVLSHAISTRTDEINGIAFWYKKSTLQTLYENGIANGIIKIRAHMYDNLKPYNANAIDTYLSAWTDEITLFDGPPFEVDTVLTSMPILAPDNLDYIVENLAFLSKDSSAYYTLQIKNSDGNWENFKTVRPDNIGLDKVYWVENIGGANATTQDNDPRNYIFNDVINIRITGHNDNLPFSLCLDYLDFQVNYKENSENYLASFYGNSGRLMFNMVNYSYPNQTWVYDDGAVIVAQQNSSVMASGGAPTPPLVYVEPGDGNNIKVYVNHFVLTRFGRSSISSGGWSTIRAKVVDNYPVKQATDGPNASIVSIEIYTSPYTDQAWVKYLSGLCDDFNALGYNSSLDRNPLADISGGEHLTLTIQGKDNVTTNPDISYYETVTEVQVQLA